MRSRIPGRRVVEVLAAITEGMRATRTGATVVAGVLGPSAEIIM